MGWKDNLRPGSFRNISFFIDTSSRTMGRRAVVHEFPNRETPFVEDLGRIANTFEVEGHVLGDDYFKAKKSLETAFNKDGAGELIHPYWGAQQVQVGAVTITESNLEGAIAKFTAIFYEKGDNRFPKGINDKGAILSDSVTSSLDTLEEDFQDKFSIAGLPEDAIASARNTVGTFSAKMNKVVKAGGAFADGVASVAFATRNLVAEVDDLLQAPDQLSARLRDSFDLLQGAFDKAEDQASAMGEFFSFGSDDETSQPEVVGNTPIRDKERVNLDSLNDFIKGDAANKAAESAVTADYVSFQDAENQRDEIVAVLEELIEKDDGVGNQVYQDLADVKAQIVNALPDVDADLPNIKEVTLDRDQNSLTLAYDFFENPDNEQDIIDRNDIRNPGNISKGTTLEVLDG